MIKYWTAVKVELAREGAVAKEIINRGYRICQLIEVRYTRKNRHAKTRHFTETNILPGKVIALLPDLAISMDEMGDIPHVNGIAKDAQWQPWRIPEPELLDCMESLGAVNSGEWARLINEAEQDNQARRGKKKRSWVKLGDASRSLLQSST